MDGLFHQVLELYRKLGLVKLGRVALDGTSIKASVSKHKSKRYDRLVKKEDDPRETARRIVRESEEVDAEADRLYGPENIPYMNPLPADWEGRLKRLREARKALEAREKKRKQAVEFVTASAGAV